MKEIVIATRNRKKLAELRRLLKNTGIKVICLDDFKGLPKDIKEDKKTFYGNARKKALTISNRINDLVIADDSGLEIPCLGNAPGVKSARYAGPSQDDEKNIQKLLKDMRHLKGRARRACFKCVICVSKGKRVIKIVEGTVWGRIAFKRQGDFGFGYDPIFIPRGCKKTFAQLGARVKDKISHRSKALKKARRFIQSYFRKYR